ncbi:hypothetical protein K438DRAFT_298937 [Mycena galopus ATCC 62051]|nr:hypothetical protein K438DRAFT_298937 [Mycena galopus ATCC 62051]
MPIFSNPEMHSHRHVAPPTHPSMTNGGNANSWSASVLKKTLAYTTPNGSPTPPPRSMSRPPPPVHNDSSGPSPPQIHIFRIATPLPPPQPMNPPTRSSSPSPFLPSVGSSRAAAAPQQQSTNALSNLSLNASRSPPRRRRPSTRCAHRAGASRACARRARCGRSCARVSSNASGRRKCRPSSLWRRLREATQERARRRCRRAAAGCGTWRASSGARRELER